MTHFDLNNQAAFKQWFDDEKAAYDRRGISDFELLVDINADGSISDQALNTIRSQVDDYNFALYRLDDKSLDHLATVKNIGRQMGLKELDKNLCAREDRITQLSVKEQGQAATYIPYSNKAIGWHTDGYYNPMHQRVLAMVLHCERPALSGGVNQLLDPDMVYIHLREEDPRFIQALSDPGVMCIPENVQDGELIRPKTCSAVFLIEQEQDDAVLAMRFSKRKRNIDWAEDSLTQEALDCLFEYLDADTPYHIEYRLNAGEGVINNNVLHTRSAFEDNEQHRRIYYRARYYNRINIQ
jgi:hypothetical protein